MISVIIPVYNEARDISACLESLAKQTIQQLEVIVVDDGSSDDTLLKVETFIKAHATSHVRYTLHRQDHKGPAKARNLGATHARGTILVFADADMTFEPHYIEKLIQPIQKDKAKGTFTKDEYVANWGNHWARCWNYNEGIGTDRRVPEYFPDMSPVFRAIRRDEFERVGGFDDIGFTDDWTLSRKLGYKAAVAPGAICYHKNPQTLTEVYSQARWIGKNEFLTGTLIRKVASLVRFNPFIQLVRGLYLSIQYRDVHCVQFAAVYYTGITVSVLYSFVGEAKSK